MRLSASEILCTATAGDDDQESTEWLEKAGITVETTFVCGTREYREVMVCEYAG